MDADFQYLDEPHDPSIEVSEKLYSTIDQCMRIGISAGGAMVVINSLLEALNRDDLMVGHTGN